MSSARISSFDGLRALAILLVYLSHKNDIGRFFGTGGYGVHLFFVLSGFLIIGMLAQDRAAIAAGAKARLPTLGKFYINRIFRIWPAYFAVAALVAAAASVGIADSLSAEEAFSIVTFTVNFFIGHAWFEFPKGWGVLWSVAIEEQFYLWVAPLILFAPQRWAGPLCTVVLLVALLVGAWSYASGVPHLTSYVGSVTNFGLMAFGGLVALWKPRLPSLLTPILLLLFIAAPFLIRSVVARESAFDLVVFWFAPILVAFALVDLQQNQQSMTSRILSLWPLRALGRISYGFYLLHNIPLQSRIGGAVGLAVDFVVVVAASALMWLLLEKPMLELRDRTFAHGRVIGAQQPASI